MTDDTLHHEVTGTGHAVLLLHPGVGDSSAWDDQVPALCARHRVVRCDLRGAGQSPVPPRPHAHHDDVADLLDTVRAERAHVIGASFGGSVAIELALAHPARVASLMLVAPALGGFPPDDEIAAFGQEEDRLYEAGELDAAAELNVRTWVDGPHRGPTEVAASVRDRVRDMQRRVFEIPEPDEAELIELSPPARERLEEIRIPTLVVSGVLDVPWMHAIAKEICARIPGCESVDLDGVAHLPNLEDPDRFNALALEWLSRQAG